MSSKLDILFSNVNKDFKEDIASKGAKRIQTQKIPFSSPRANYMLYGGLPRGRIIEFAGEENGGKTTTALDIVANAQRLFKKEHTDRLTALSKLKKPSKGEQSELAFLKSSKPKSVIYADCENTLDEDWAVKLGVNIAEMYVLRPQSQTAEQIFDILLSALETGEVGLMVIDSLGVMVSAQAYEKTMMEKTYGGISAALTLFSKRAEMLCSKYNTTLIGINQMREDLSSPYGGTTTTGGKGWKHNCSVRLMFQKGDYIDENNNKLKRNAESPAGNLVMIHIAKTKVCKPDRRLGFYTLKYDTGIDAIADMVEVAIKYGMIIQEGAWFTAVDTETGEIIEDETGNSLKWQGKAKVIEYFRQDDILRNEFYKIIYDKISD